MNIKKFKIIRLDKNGVNEVTMVASLKKPFGLSKTMGSTALKQEVMKKFGKHMEKEHDNFLVLGTCDSYSFLIRSSDWSKND